MRNNKWVRLLAHVTGSVNQELLIQNEYLAAKNRILRSKMPLGFGFPIPNGSLWPRSGSVCYDCRKDPRTTKR